MICEEISKEDLDKLLDLYIKAQNTPVISFTGKANDDWSIQAWTKVRDFQKELGGKYNYDWKNYAVNGKGKLIKVCT